MVLSTVARVLIVATGPSVEGVQIPELPRVHIIAINDAVGWLPRADSFFSMDTGPHVQTLLKRRREGVQYYMALPAGSRMQRHKGVIHLLRLMGTGPRGTCWKLAESPTAIHAGNSAYGALNLAYHWRPKKVAILGLDGTAYGHAYNRRFHPGCFAHLPELFASAGPQLEKRKIEVVNGSKRSKITCFQRMRPNEAIEWLAA